jgi:serine/threonine-protein kinase
VAKGRPKIEKSVVRPGGLALAALFGGLCAAWAAFQWWELVVARRGGEIVCAPGGGGHCAEVWDSGFAASVHTWTGLPVAGWGVAWGLVALALPLLTRARLARLRAADAWLAATLITAVSGALGVAVLIGASVRFGHICATCGLSYVLVLTYAAVCFLAVRGAMPGGLARGAGLAASGLVIAFAALLVPGLRTPQNSTAAGARAVGELTRLPANSSDDHELARLIRESPEQVRQLLSDMLADYAASPVWEPPPARTVIGPPGSRLVLTEWSDTLCSHCAQLHETLLQLQERFGPDAFSLAPHYYPLDPSCNAGMERREKSDPLPCTSARVQICAEGRPGAFELTGELFRRQRELTEPLLLELAGRVVPQAELEACLHSPETERKLQGDIAWAIKHGIQGTPLLLVGGRKVMPFPPLIYALALTRGSPSHPEFAALPPPQPLPLH